MCQQSDIPKSKNNAQNLSSWLAKGKRLKKKILPLSWHIFCSFSWYQGQVLTNQKMKHVWFGWSSGTLCLLCLMFISKCTQTWLTVYVRAFLPSYTVRECESNPAFFFFCHIQWISPHSLLAVHRKDNQVFVHCTASLNRKRTKWLRVRHTSKSQPNSNRLLCSSASASVDYSPPLLLWALTWKQQSCTILCKKVTSCREFYFNF